MKHVKFIILCVIALLALSCKKETAVTTDNINPILKCRIYGNGVDKTFYSDSTILYGSGHLYLDPNTVYNFTVSVVDTGGVSFLQISTDTMAFRTQNLIPAPAPLYDTFIPPSTYYYSIIGNANNPYISFLLTGKLAPKSSANPAITYYLNCKGSDYTPNTVSINIPCIIDAQSPFGYGWK